MIDEEMERRAADIIKRKEDREPTSGSRDEPYKGDERMEGLPKEKKGESFSEITKRKVEEYIKTLKGVDSDEKEFQGLREQLLEGLPKKSPLQVFTEGLNIPLSKEDKDAIQEYHQDSSQDGGALRYNKGKLPMHLVPVTSIEGIAEVLRYGAGKYAERNWERGFEYSIPYACAMRHLTQWWKGEDLDAESGLSHMKHVLANIAMIVEFMETYPQGDDRVKRNNKSEEL